MNRLFQRQRGAFAIELIFVLFGLCVIFFFVTDLSHKLLVRAQLDSTSFSLVNILKERTHYYARISANTRVIRYALSATDLQDMQLMASRMMHVPIEKVAVSIEANIDKVTQRLSSQEFETLGCQPTTPIEAHDLLIPRQKNRTHFPLYQVTLCARHDGWFLPFVNNKNGKSMITSSSVMAGW